MKSNLGWVIPRGDPEIIKYTNGFTLNKRYPIRFMSGIDDCHANVLNDNGYERVVSMDGSLSPHLIREGTINVCCGYFEVVFECDKS